MNKVIDFIRYKIPSSLIYFLISIAILWISIYTLIQYYSYGGNFINYNNYFTMLKVRSSIVLLSIVGFAIANIIDIRRNQKQEEKVISSKRKLTSFFFRLATFFFLLTAFILTIFMKFIIMLENWALSG